MERIFGKNLRAIRIHLGLNQANFAKPLGITGGYVLEIERGNIKKPSLPVIMAMKNKYQVNTNFLETGVG